MKPAENIKRLIEKSHITTSSATDTRIIGDALTELETLKQKQSANNRSQIRRTIMNKKITRLTAAAIIIIAAVLGITLIDKSTAPAYAVEQTIQAMKSVRFMHIVKNDDTGQLLDERWIEIDSDGVQARYRQDSPPRGFFVVDNRQNIMIYHKDKNTVLLYGPDGEQYTWIWNPGQFFKEVAGDGSIMIKENVDYWGTKAHLVSWLTLNTECYIDAETKLPIAMNGYDISYEYPPEDTFDIIIPDGVTLIDKRPGAEPTEEPDWLKDDDIAQKEFDQAREALAAGQYDKAIGAFKKVVELQPLRNWAWFWLGSTYYQMGEHDSAIHTFSAVIDMFTGHDIIPHYCYLARGFAYRATGMEAMAKRDFAIALPVMISSLRNIQAAWLFDAADDPVGRGRNAGTAEQRLAKMIDRLTQATGQNFGYDPDAAIEDNAQAIAAWEQWWSQNAADYGTKE